MRKRHILSQALRATGALTLLDHLYWGSERLTVLAHHRITDPDADDFVGLRSNVSATPQQFAQQLAYIQQHFNVISLDQLRTFVYDDVALPDRPLLITFDDGYRDNYENAYPLLRQYDMPAVIFTVTGRMDDPRPLWWDVTAQAFRETRLSAADLPHIGHRQLDESAETDLVVHIKTLPTAAIDDTLHQLCEALQVERTQSPLFFDWDAVRELCANGIACQPHTVNHPIMTRIPPEQGRDELRQSRQALLEHSGQQHVDTFAYPNGYSPDFNRDTICALHDLDYKLAMTLIPGPMPLAEARQHPMQIKRVYLSHRDTLDIFITKVLGVPALMDQKTLYLEA